MKIIKVCVYREYEVDVSHLDPEFVNINDFAEDEAYRIFEDDFINGELLPCDFNATII